MNLLDLSPVERSVHKRLTLMSLSRLVDEAKQRHQTMHACTDTTSGLRRPGK